MPTDEEALLWTQDCFVASRKLSSLGSPTNWPKHIVKEWSSYLSALALKSAPLLEKPTPLGLYQCAVWFLEAPTKVLSRFVKVKDAQPSDHDQSFTQDSATSSTRAAAAAMKLGDYGKAFRHLTGNGLAAPTAANYLAMEKLFPARNYDLVFPPIVGPQLNISLPDVQASLFKSSQRKKTSPDSFGYSGALLSLTRAAKSTPEAPAFHTVLATFMHKVVNIQGPDDPEAPPPLVAFLLKAGVAFGSHKDDLATQRHKQALGQPPSLRPVVSGRCWHLNLQSNAHGCPCS
jgi:hypothetical protein